MACQTAKTVKTSGLGMRRSLEISDLITKAIRQDRIFTFSLGQPDLNHKQGLHQQSNV